MKTLRRVVAPLLSFALAFSPLSSAGAVSLYDGLKTSPTPTAPVVPIQPNIGLPVLGQAIPAIPTLPSIPTLDATVPQIPQLPTAPLAAQVPAAQTAAAPAAAALEAAGTQLRAAAPAQAQNALDTLFAGTPNAARATDEAGIVAHIGNAIGEYFGVLPRGQEPGVVVSKKKRPAVEGAPTDTEMEDNVKASPRTNPEREQIAIRMFEKAGAKYDAKTSAVTTPDFSRDGQVQVQEVKGWGGEAAHNIFVVKKGRPKNGQPERVIVITSHNDKVDVGDGVIDNWTGTTMVAHLYQSIKDKDTEATYIFAAFAREEEGLVGSKTWVRSLSPAQRALIESNINYDTIAIKGGGTNSWDNQSQDIGSDEVMLAMADTAVAEANKGRAAGDQLDLKRQSLNGGDADSSTFRRQRPPIPAMTIFSGPEELIFSIIHSAADNIGAFDFALYKNTYLVALAIIGWLDAHPVAPAAAPAS